MSLAGSLAGHARGPMMAAVSPEAWEASTGMEGTDKNQAPAAHMEAPQELLWNQLL